MILCVSAALVLVAGPLAIGEALVAPAFGIDLEKLVNGIDADSAPGPLIAAGSPVTFTYELRNTGAGFFVQLSILSISDDNGTPGDTADDFTPTFVGGDTLIVDNQLDLGEIWTYTATKVAVLGQYANSATVTALALTGVQFTDSDAGHYFGVVAVPEPGSILLLGIGFAGLAVGRRRWWRKV